MLDHLCFVHAVLLQRHFFAKTPKIISEQLIWMKLPTSVLLSHLSCASWTRHNDVKQSGKVHLKFKKKYLLVRLLLKIVFLLRLLKNLKA